MNLGRRILRLAKHRVLHGLRGSRAADPAREELEGYLQEPPVTSPPPQSHPRQAAKSSSDSGGSAAASAGGGSRSSGAQARTGGSSSGAGQARAKPGPPPPPPPHPYAAEYRLLGVAVGADLAAVRAAWRARVKENHPDRFAGDPDAQRRAADRLRAINEAHDALRRHLERKSAR